MMTLASTIYLILAKAYYHGFLNTLKEHIVKRFDMLNNTENSQIFWVNTQFSKFSES